MEGRGGKNSPNGLRRRGYWRPRSRTACARPSGTSCGRTIIWGGTLTRMHFGSRRTAGLGCWSDWAPGAHTTTSWSSMPWSIVSRSESERIASGESRTRHSG